METKNGYKVYPLTVAQKFHAYYLEFCPDKAVVNIGVSLTIGIDVDFEVLKQSIYEAYDRCDFMRIRMTKGEDGEWYQYIVDKEERDIEYVDFRGKTMEEAEEIMKSWTRVPFEREDSPLNKLVMITTPDGFNGSYLLGDHLMMDAQALIGFMRDVIELYCHKQFPNEAPYPKDMVPYFEQIERDLKYEAGSKAQQRDREYFQKLIEESEPIYNSINGSGQLKTEREKYNNPELRACTNAAHENVTTKLDVFHLEEEPTQRLIDFCEEYHVSLTCLLLMGLRTYFQKVNGNDDVSVNTCIARRATLREKKSGGTRIHSFPFRTIIGKDTTFIDAIYQIRDLQNEYFKHANYNPVEFLAYRGKTYPVAPGQTYEPISLTYQPLSLNVKELDRIADVKYKTKWYPNGASAQAMYLTVMHRPDDNGLDFNFEHQVEIISTKQLEYMYYYICKIMFKGIENPNLTVGDIINLV